MSKLGAVLSLLAVCAPTIVVGPATASTIGTITGGDVTLRVIRDDVPERIVYWLGTSTEPRKLTRETAPHLGELTGDAVAKAFCGHVFPGYWRAFEALNGLDGGSFQPSALLQDKAYDYRWPACVYVERGDFSHVVKDRLASDVYLEATGSPGMPNTFRHFFEGSGIKDLSQIKPGQVLRYGFRTQPVTFKPIGAADDFAKALAAESVAWVGNPSKAFASPPIPPTTTDGEIILHATAHDGAVAAASSPPAECAAVTAQPFDLGRVVAAYQHGKANERPLVPLVVVDNGFFGASRDAGKVTFTPLFNRRLFHVDTDSYGTERIGSVLSIGGEVIQPINWENDFAPGYTPDTDAGHGTHVTRLAMGGDAINRQELFPPGSGPSWLQVSIIAFSKGQRKIPAHSATQFSDALVQLKLQPASIVNMSLKFGPGVETLMTNVIRLRDETLFVVAAGNDRRDLDDGETQVYPAALGKEPNVLTVAAEDGSGQLTEFTNKSGDFVGIAAPGCNIASTLDGIQSAALSGTSQAAPTVAFAAALLARRGLPLAEVKRRLVLSGDLITGVHVRLPDGTIRSVPATSDAEVAVSSRARLNLPKALLFDQDYLVYRETDNGPPIHALGTLSSDRSGPTCGGQTRAFRNVLAFRRSPVDGAAWCYWKDQLTPRAVKTGPKHALSFKVDYVIDAAGKPQPDSRVLENLPLNWVDEFVMSRVNMNIYK